MIKIMEQMGFPSKWLCWIKSLFGSARSSVLLNGTPGRKFYCKRGVRQGDPLSPLLFVIAADLLQAAINLEFRQGNLLAPIPAEGQDYPVVQYANDTIAVLPADLAQIVKMKSILREYAESVGLHINFAKSTLVPINLAEDRAAHLAQALGCSLGKMPFTYLGLPMGTTRPTVSDFMRW